MTLKNGVNGSVSEYVGGIIVKIFNRLFCKHEWKLIDRVYGDMKNVYSSYYKCEKCGKEELK